MAKQRKFGGLTISSKIMSVVVVTLLATVALFVLTFYLVSQDLSSQLLKQFDYRLTTDIDTAKKKSIILMEMSLALAGRMIPFMWRSKRNSQNYKRSYA